MIDSIDPPSQPGHSQVQEQFSQMLQELREGCFRFSSKLRGQAGIIIDEMIDPEGEAIANLADMEGDAGALALAVPVDTITLETWLLGQFGDQEKLDLKNKNHNAAWFNFGAWIGEALRRRHGGHWLIGGEDPKTWRLGFSKLLLEIAPFAFAEQLIKTGPGIVRNLLTEFENLRDHHQEQEQRDGGKSLDRFTAEHYIRMYSMPLGQWLVVDYEHIGRLWNEAAAKNLHKEFHKAAEKLPQTDQAAIKAIDDALSAANPQRPLASQSGDRGLLEALTQIIAIRRGTSPIAMDILEQFVLPTIHIGIPDKFPPLDEEDIANLRKGIELFAFYVDIVPHQYKADDEGFLKSIPQEDLASPYPDQTQIDISKGDWVIVNPKHFKDMLLAFDSKRLLETYDKFVEHIAKHPDTPRRRDDGRMLAETVCNSIAELKACVIDAAQNNQALVFRMLPPPR